MNDGPLPALRQLASVFVVIGVPYNLPMESASFSGVMRMSRGSARRSVSAETRGDDGSVAAAAPLIPRQYLSDAARCSTDRHAYARRAPAAGGSATRRSGAR